MLIEVVTNLAGNPFALLRQEQRIDPSVIGDRRSFDQAFSSSLSATAVKEPLVSPTFYCSRSSGYLHFLQEHQRF